MSAQQLIDLLQAAIAKGDIAPTDTVAVSLGRRLLDNLRPYDDFLDGDRDDCQGIFTVEGYALAVNELI